MAVQKCGSQDELVLSWTKELEARLNKNAKDGTTLKTLQLIENKEKNIFIPAVTFMAQGATTLQSFSYEFFASLEYSALVELGKKIVALGLGPDAYVVRGEKTQKINCFIDAYAWLMEETKKGLTIQRYKGLGEMNAEQLWETTMDPKTRIMVKVTNEDLFAADQYFTMLMGDHVEPRRDFIDKNAIYVENLDV